MSNVVIGYSPAVAPTYTDADIDRINETEAANLWERLNTIPNEGKYKAAAAKIKEAVQMIDKATDILLDAAETAKDTALEIRLRQKVYDIEDQKYEISDMADNAGKGCEP